MGWGSTVGVWRDAHDPPLAEFALPVTSVNKSSHSESSVRGAHRSRCEKWPPNCTAAIGPAAPSADDGYVVLSKRITNAKFNRKRAHRPVRDWTCMKRACLQRRRMACHWSRGGAALRHFGETIHSFHPQNDGRERSPMSRSIDACMRSNSYVATVSAVLHEYLYGEK